MMLYINVSKGKNLEIGGHVNRCVKRNKLIGGGEIIMGGLQFERHTKGSRQLGILEPH